MIEKTENSPKQKPRPNQKLRYERERRCWSQQELADKIGTTPLNIGRWERGVTFPGAYYRQKLCEVFEKNSRELGLIPESKEPELQEQRFETDQEAEWHIGDREEASFLVWNVPYRRNLFFTGREDILTELREAFVSDGQPLAITQPYAISGLGGVGKTQTAVEYAYRYRESYSSIFWARADSHDLLISDYLVIAGLLKLPESNHQDQSAIVNAVKRWFDTHKSWLLILDNADHLDQVESFMPSARDGHVLLTTRAYSTGTVAQRIELGKMNEEEGTWFLLRRTKRHKGAASLQGIPSDVREQAQAIVRELDGLPLALDQAGAYIEETACSFADYLRYYKTKRGRLLQKRGNDASGHPEPVAGTWALSFARIKRAHPAASELLKLCAFLHPDAIPETMITEGASELGPILQPVVEDEIEFNEAIGELLRYSMVRRNSEEKTLSIHRLVQVVLKDGMEEQERRIWEERTIGMMCAVFPTEIEVPSWPKCQSYIPHVEICFHLLKQKAHHSVEASQLLDSAGQYLQQRYQYKEAEPFLSKALTMREQLLGAEHTLVAQCLRHLGWLYFEQGKYSQAEQFYQKAMTMQEQVSGPEHPDVAEVLNEMGLLYWQTSRYTEAEALHKRSLAIRERLFGLEDLQVAASLNNLALIYHYRDQYAEAEPLYKRALAIWERVLGPNHLDTMTGMNNLGILYCLQKKYDQAEELLQRVIARYEHVVGLEHVDAILSIFNLALTYNHTERYDKAEPLFKQAAELWEKVVGAYHPSTIIGLNGLGVCYLNQRKYHEAAHVYERALAIQEEITEVENAEKSGTLNNLAEVYLEQGKFSQAEPLFLRALAIREQVMGSENVAVGRTLYGLARTYCAQERYEEAEPLFQRALAIREQHLGPEHPFVARTLECYAHLLRQIERSDEAVALEKRIKAIRTRQEQAGRHV